MNINDLELKLIGVDRLVPREDVLTAVLPDGDNPIMDYRKYLISPNADSPNIIGGSLLVGIICDKQIFINRKTGQLGVGTESIFLGQRWCTGGSYLDPYDINLESSDTPDGELRE